MSSQRIFNNAMKATYLVKLYPEHKLGQIISLMTMPGIDINTALWYATEAGWINQPEGTQEIELGKAPDHWEFGETVQILEDMLKLSFTELAKKETDLEENYLSNWTQGYAAHDVIIALQHLIELKVLASYQLTDPKDTKSTYTFYSLYDNAEQMWGRKQFKVQPTGDEVPAEDDAPTEE